MQHYIINNKGFERSVNKNVLPRILFFFFYTMEKVIYVYKHIKLQELTDHETKQLQQLLLNQLH